MQFERQKLKMGRNFFLVTDFSKVCSRWYRVGYFSISWAAPLPPNQCCSYFVGALSTFLQYILPRLIWGNGVSKSNNISYKLFSSVLHQQCLNKCYQHWLGEGAGTPKIDKHFFIRFFRRCCTSITCINVKCRIFRQFCSSSTCINVTNID